MPGSVAGRTSFAMSLGQNTTHAIDYSDPSRPCRCDEPAADPEIMTCVYCGHQVGGVQIPSRIVPRKQPALGDHSRPARKRQLAGRGPQQ